MAAAFSSRQQPLQGRPLRSNAPRGREAPMDFAYEQPSASAASSSSSPFLAALQSEAARRNQQRTAEQAAVDADMRDTSGVMQDDHEGDDADDSHGRGRAHPTPGGIRQFPVGGFSALSLHRKRSQSRRSAGLLGGGGASSAEADDPNDTTMEDVAYPSQNSTGAATAGQQHGDDDEFIDVEGDEQGRRPLLSSAASGGPDRHSSSSALIHGGSSSMGVGSSPATGPPIVNYFLAPFFPNSSSSQMQQYHHQGSDSQSQIGHPYSHDSKMPWIGAGVHHMDWPELLLSHAQFIFNASLLAATLYLLFLIARTVQRDVEWKWLEYRAELETQIAACKTSYDRNHCASPTLGVDFQAQCAFWARCMHRDPNGVGRSRVFAETVADIANGFVDRVSWKTMAFTLLCLFIVVRTTNSTLSSYRHAYATQRHNANQSSRSSRGGSDRRGNKNAGGGGGGRRRKGQQQQQQLSHGRARAAIALE
ncbi:unnamed protein product [Tilletia laevis]|uniref:Brl1/Brr6 domain-containing protein n=2 Tax=Tilletia TaxID=13289 RepID=A0A177V864_9BASI|nr:hypothetical protein CF336_g6395 [Tilletia laevis]KAE8251546.1 hypothetical protein A4X03_0g6354 [Tilletia caries]KAE8193205.1 hypothetical protein CF335_g5652 [Tilletia laevis]CAD6884796.1 unnamed protein product [Tilletia caries]CAD6896560.1 unnamed protein product [Tilletia caries]